MEYKNGINSPYLELNKVTTMSKETTSNKVLLYFKDDELLYSKNSKGEENLITTGSKGDKGSPGTDGVKGDTGSTGPQGFQGSRGFQGTTGATGPQGFQGNQGTQGVQGSQGVSGQKGSEGITGPQGFQGNQGTQGVQGSQGLRGFQGFQGQNASDSGVSMVYGENISVGDVVYYNRSDGKVKKVYSLGLGYNDDAWTGQNVTYCINTTNNTILSYGESGGNYSLRAGTISGNTISWGTAVSLYSSTTLATYMKIVYHSNQDVFVLMYNDPSNSNYLTFRAASVSGNTITLGSAVVVTSTVTTISLCNMLGTDYCACMYKPSGNIAVRTISVSGTSLTLNASYDAGSTGTNRVGVGFDSVNSHIYTVSSGTSITSKMLRFTYDGSGNLTLNAGTNDTNVLTTGEIISTTNGGKNSELGLFCSDGVCYTISTLSTGNHIVSSIVAETFSSSNDRLVLYPISNIFLNQSSLATTYSNVRDFICVNGVIYIQNGSSTTSEYAGYSVYDIKSKRMLYYNQPNVNSTDAVGSLMAVSNNKIIFRGSYGSGLTTKILSMDYYIYSDIVGIANESGVNNDSKLVLVNNQVYTTTGLTAGKTYYVTRSGTLGYTSGYVIGKALSSTKLLIGIL